MTMQFRIDVGAFIDRLDHADAHGVPYSFVRAPYKLGSLTTQMVDLILHPFDADGWTGPTVRIRIHRGGEIHFVLDDVTVEGD
jgi:hypothetical protein